MFFASFAYADSGFKHWIKEFRKTAIAHNITPSTFHMAFKGVNTIDPAVLKSAAYQPEFVAPSWNYFDNRVHDIAIAEGRRQAKNGINGFFKLKNVLVLIAIFCLLFGQWRAIMGKF